MWSGCDGVCGVCVCVYEIGVSMMVSVFGMCVWSECDGVCGVSVMMCGVSVTE